jgi:hypothetical protein
MTIEPIWIDLGNGTAIAAGRIAKLWISPPWPPGLVERHSRLPGLSGRGSLLRESWVVSVLDAQTNTIHRVGFFNTEGQARCLAREIVGRMHQEVDRLV